MAKSGLLGPRLPNCYRLCERDHLRERRFGDVMDVQSDTLKMFFRAALPLLLMAYFE